MRISLALLFCGFAHSLWAAPLDISAQINSYIQGERVQGKVASNERTAWYAYDLTTGKPILSINADRPLQAASMIKPFVALAFFHRVKRGEIVYGAKSKAQLNASIQRSDNKATNWMMRHAGGPAGVQAVLTKHYSNIFKNTKIVEYIPAGGRTYRNYASALDYGRFLSALWKNELPYAWELRRAMALPGRDRLYSSTPIPRGTMVYNKTGSTARLCGDMGILVANGKDGKKYPYTIVGIIEKSKRTPSYTQWMRQRGNVIRRVSTKVYQALKKRYNLL